jgi:hypothetical protein
MGQPLWNGLRRLESARKNLYDYVVRRERGVGPEARRGGGGEGVEAVSVT